MLIDPVEVAILATASTIGALAAAVILHFATKLFRLKRKAWASFLFLMLGAVSGLAFLTEPLLPILAPILVRILPDPVYFQSAMEDPLLGRLAEDHPELTEGLEARLIAAHFVGGMEGVRFEGERFGLERSASLTAQYFVRAQRNDLLTLMEMQGEIFQSLAASSPDLCYPFLFGLGKEDVTLAKRLDLLIPEALEEQTRKTILGAHDQVPTFDRDLGQSLIEAHQRTVALDHGEEGVALMSGERHPASKEEAETLCRIYAGFFSAISAEGPARAEAAYRTLFARAITGPGAES